MNLVLTLLKGIDKPKRRVLLAVVMASCASMASVGLIGVSSWLLSRAAELPPVMYLTAAAVGVRFFGISRGVFRYLERLVGHSLGLRMQSSLRLLTYERLSGTTLLGRRRGDLLSRIVADVEAILDIVVRVFVPLSSGFVTILGCTIILSMFEPASAAALMASSLVAALIAPWVANRLSHAADAAAVPARGALATITHEVARTSADLVAYGAQDEAMARLVEADAKLREVEHRAAWSRGLAVAIQILAAGTAVVLALWFGSHAVIDGRMDRPLLAVLVLTPLALHEVFGDFAKAAQMFTRATVALRRVEAVLDAEPVGCGDLVAREATGTPSIVLENATIGWPGATPLVSGFNLRVEPGERVALVGPSGVGKTTVAATVLGLIPPLAGVDSSHGRVGYLAQDAHIFASTVEENVKIGNKDASEEEVGSALAKAGLPVDPKTMVGELGSTLSGGEQRRLAAARLFAGRYDAFVLDEPSEHLDPETASALLDDLWRMTEGAPMLVITHDPEVILRCDRVVTLGRRTA